MIQKRILVPERLRRPPSTGWSWMDRRFIRDHASKLPRDAVLLYFFLAAVSDGQGLSFYSDPATATLLRMPLENLVRARDELIGGDFIAWEAPLTQVLSLPAVRVERQRDPGQGLSQLGDLFRQVAGQWRCWKNRVACCRMVGLHVRSEPPSGANFRYSFRSRRPPQTRGHCRGTFVADDGLQRLRADLEMECGEPARRNILLWGADRRHSSPTRLAVSTA